MKTITFYSYKGGVGRSLALSNIAIKLSQLKKKVFVIDFDLDAPGLQFKFDEDYTLLKNKDREGLVDYIHKFAKQHILPDNVASYIDVLKAKNINDDDINFLSAGDFENTEYWRKLASISWSDLFYVKGGFGVRFFLDLKAKIEKEFNPDYLLIDSRTGITDIAGITLKLLADEAVVLAVNNSENLFGTKKIIATLVDPKKELLNHNLKIHFALTRLPFPKEPEDKANEYAILKRWEKELAEISNGRLSDISVIHTDKQLHKREIVKIGPIANTNTISYEYSQLLEKLTDGDIDTATAGRFDSIKEAENLFNKARHEKDSISQFEYLNKAIELDSSRYEYFMERGLLYFTRKNIDLALADFQKALKIKPNDDVAYHYIGNLYYNKGDYQLALDHLNKIIIPYEDLYLLKGLTYYNLGQKTISGQIFDEGIRKFPDSVGLLNGRANYYRKEKLYQEAFNDIYKAIELAPDNGILFAVLGEISYDAGKVDDFYLNLNLALSKGITASQLNGAKNVYAKVKNETRFLQLLEKYQIRLEEILK